MSSNDDAPAPDIDGSEVAAAALALIDAFAAHDVEAYFDWFDPDASFVFHTEDSVMWGREAYRTRWREWEAQGFRVESCVSYDGRVEPLGADAAVWIHRLATRLAGVAETTYERESIVFRRRGGRWVAVHEHLSADPAPDVDRTGPPTSPAA
jgi:ketosteroid isomerase-like protein